MSIIRQQYTFCLVLLCLLLNSISARTQGNLAVTATVTPSTCGEASGSITFSAIGGTPPYQYAFANRKVFQSSSYLPVPGPGIDTAWVMDATGALAYTLVDMGNTWPPVYPYNAGQTEPVDCTTPDGQITVGVNGGTPPFSYSLDEINYQSSPTFLHLHPGYYFTFVKDANGCLGSYSFLVVPTKCQLINEDVVSFTCTNTGKLVLDPGTIPQPVQYSLDGINYQSSSTFSNLIPGQYTVYAIDGNSQKYVITTFVYPDCALSLTGTEIDATCGSKNGSLNVHGVNGFPPYQYSIDGVNFQLTGSFTGLSDGGYTVLVKDGSGQIKATLFIIASGCPSVSATATAALCGNANGSITAFPGPVGTPPFQYSIDDIHFQSSGVFSNLPAGYYTVTIKDANNYIGNTTIAVTNTCLTITTNPTVTYCSQADGSITVSVAGGVPPYGYSVDGVNFQTSNILAGLAASNYTITVKDAAGNIGSTLTTITDISGPALTTQSTAATCAGSDGTITLIPNGGTPPYEYSLDNINWQPSAILTGLNTGNYLPYIKDAFGCVAGLPVTITLTNNLTLSLGDPVSICQGNEVTFVAASNGIQFSWSPTTDLSNPAVLRPTANPTTTTTYSCAASWGTCKQQASITVTVNPAPTPAISPDTTICYGQSVQLNASGGTTYSWSPSTNLNNADLPNPIVQNPEQTITYQISVTDPLGCTSLQPATVTVHVTPPAKLFAGDDTSVLINQPLQLAAIDINHSGFTTYTWAPATGLNNPDIPNPIASPTINTTYTVIAETPEGCEGTASVTIKVYTAIDLIVPNAFTPNGDGHNDILKAIPLGIKTFQYFAVFNRWGQRIFYSTDPNKGWDGTVDGKPQPTGTYVWMAAGIGFNENALQRNGTTVLIR